MAPTLSRSSSAPRNVASISRSCSAARLRILPAGDAASFSGNPAEFKLGLEAMSIQMAAQFDPMLAIATSGLDPLPHQIQAVYGDLLGRDQLLRFLLADDPGGVVARARR
jgi:hypothetical protein